MKYRKKSFAEKMVNYLLDGLVFVFGFILLIAIYTGIQTKVLGNDYNNFFVILCLKCRQEVWLIQLILVIGTKITPIIKRYNYI